MYGRRFISRGDDRGMALMTVLMSMVILSLFLVVGLAAVVKNTSVSRKTQDVSTATAAAQAGVDNFLQQLNDNFNFFNGVVIGAWAPGTGDGWTTIQGTGDSTFQYRYKVIRTDDGLVQVRLEGRSSNGDTGAVSQTTALNATYQRRGFLSYVYLSDVEVIDPALVGANAACGAYYYGGRSSRTDCSNIQWGAGDVVNGPLHSNDALQVNGATQFKGETTTAWPAAQGKDGLTNSTKTWWGTQTAPLPVNPPLYDTVLTLPTSNDKVRAAVSPDVDGDSSTPPGSGCYYTGATRIILQGTTMKVLSPATVRSDIPARCYNRSTPGVEQTVNIPPVIYVDQATTTCTLGATGYPLVGETYTAGTATATSWGKSPNYNCARGTVYIKGTSNVALTVAAKNDVVIAGNLSVADIGSSSTQVMGLIAENYIWVSHPISSGNNMLSSSQQVNTINSGILALTRSFVVQNWDAGSPLGTLNVTGAIAQKFRGAVGTSSGGTAVTGYLKNYIYDNRLAVLQPPSFLESGNVWKLVTTVSATK
jgi:hypothetical protein